MRAVVLISSLGLPMLAMAIRPNDPSFPHQWHHTVMQTERSWDIQGETVGSGTVTIAIVDSGIERTHPDLSGLLVPGYNAITGQADTFPGQYTNDLEGHGTFVAGCAGAAGNNGLGVCGMNWGFKLMPIKVTNDQGVGNIVYTLAGIDWALSHGAKVICVPRTGIGDSRVNQKGADVRAAGAVLVWAAGNNNLDLGADQWPNVLVVGATSQNDQKEITSNYGAGVDVYAPGSSILSTWTGGGLRVDTGTSASAGLVAGICGSMLAIRSDQNFHVADLEEGLYKGCKPLGLSRGRDPVWGWGRVNAYESCKRVVPYVIHNLDMAGFSTTGVSGINNIGEVMGTGDNGNIESTRGLVWPTQGPPYVIGVLAGMTYTNLSDINRSGIVVGYSVAEPNSRPFKWDRNANPQMVELPNPFGSGGQPMSINRYGEIVGYYRYGGGDQYYGIYWNTNLTANILSPISGYPGSLGEAINDAGVIVGVSQGGSPRYRACLWQTHNTSPIELGIPNGFDGSTTNAVNSASTASGWVVQNNRYYGGLYKNGQVSVLNELADSTNTFPDGINDYEQLVGVSHGVGGTPRAVIWNNGYMQDLNSLIHGDSGSGWYLKHAYGINAKGWIAGEAVRNGVSQAFLAVPYKDLGQTNLAVHCSIVLEDFLGDLTNHPVSFELWQNGSMVERIPNVIPDEAGQYQLNTLQEGTFDVYLSSEHFLRKKVPAVVFSLDNPPTIAANLINGDIDGNNVVNYTDLRYLMPRQGGASIQFDLDLNGDGRVDFRDYRICQRNLGKRGD